MQAAAEPPAGGGAASTSAPADAADMEVDSGAGPCAAAATATQDDLHCIFVALLAADPTGKSLGRIWFQLFRSLDAAEADAAKASAPAGLAVAAPLPAPVVAPGWRNFRAPRREEMNDHDYYRRFVEQHCWRRTRDLCSRCCCKTGNAAIPLWKVRLCGPCMAASVLNKSDALKQFLLASKDVQKLPTWMMGVVSPFGVPVRYFFRRHLERAAAEKHAAVGGLDGAIRQREAAAEERAKALAAERDVASQRIDALLATHSLKRGTPEWRELGQTAYDVDAFLAGRAQRKPSHASAKKKEKEKEIKALVVAATKKRSRQRAQWRDPGADGILKTAADAEAAVEMALARAMRGKLLREACAYACVTDADMQPATSAMWAAFVTGEDSAIAAAAEAKREAAAAEKRGGAPAKKKQKRIRRGWRPGRNSSSEGESSSEDDGSGSSGDESDDDVDKASGSGAAAPPSSTAAVDVSAAATAVARELILRRRAVAEAHIELECLLSVAALEAQCPTIADKAVYEKTDAYAAFLAALHAPPEPPPRRSGKQKQAAAPAPSAAQVACDAIVGVIRDRAQAFDDALEARVNALSVEWGMPCSRMAQLLGMSGSTDLRLNELKINDTLYRQSYLLCGEVREVRKRRFQTHLAGEVLQLDAAMDRLMHQLRLKLRKGEMHHRYEELFNMLYCPSVYMTHDKDAPKPRNPPTELRDGLRNLRCYYRPEYTMVISSSREARDLDWLGRRLIAALGEHRIGVSTHTNRFDFDIRLVPNSGNTIALHQGLNTELGRTLTDAAKALFTRKESRSLFVRWVLDGRAEPEGGGGPAGEVTAQDMASRILRLEHATEDLVSAIRAALPDGTPPLSLASAPHALLDQLQTFLDNKHLALVPDLDSMQQWEELCDAALENDAQLQPAGVVSVGLAMKFHRYNMDSYPRYLVPLTDASETIGQFKQRLLAALQCPAGMLGDIHVLDKDLKTQPESATVRAAARSHWAGYRPQLYVAPGTPEDTADWRVGLAVERVTSMYRLTWNTAIALSIPLILTGAQKTVGDVQSRVASLLARCGAQLPGGRRLEAHHVRFFSPGEGVDDNLSPDAAFDAKLNRFILRCDDADEATAILASFAAEELAAQANRREALEHAYEAAGLGTPPAIDFDVQNVAFSPAEAVSISLQEGFRLLLRGPNCTAFRISATDVWSKDAIETIIDKVTNDKSTAAAKVLSTKRKDEVVNKMDELTNGVWSAAASACARVHAVEQSDLFQRLIVNAKAKVGESRAADASGSVAPDDGAGPSEPGVDAPSDAFDIDAVAAELLPLFEAARAQGLSNSVLMASRNRERVGEAIRLGYVDAREVEGLLSEEDD